ncbi:MAG: NUDIX hydrolase [candidate division TM6 bacterium GW2011_GWF2_37_49]|nr:MAG: NUDIX hydrolase [candidate division TM6 bacterium GW2011_GWF2_37_49]
METQKNKFDANKTIIKKDEKILVVPRKDLFPEKAFNGFLPLEGFSSYLEIIKTHKEFKWRSEMELDPAYKQIIPYIVFIHQNKLFIMQRQSTASETRLQSKFSLGIGGHIRQEDIAGDDIFEWAKREFNEEVNYEGSLQVKPLGLVNYDEDAVGQVHLGFIILLTGDNNNISVKSELKSGELLSIEECQKHYQNMESWSQFVFDFLKGAQK